MTINHEEGDVIIVNQTIKAAKNGFSSIKVVCDDVDVFVLLVHFYHLCAVESDIIMIPTSRSTNGTNIGSTVRNFGDLSKYILSLHALTGCDTVSTMYGIGKNKALNSLKGGHIPPQIGDLDSDISVVMKDATHFIASCYGVVGQKNHVGCSICCLA